MPRLKVLTFLMISLLVIPFGRGMTETGEPSEAETKPDPWPPVRFFLGQWKGQGIGLGGNSTVEHSYEFILQDRFVHTKTRAVFEPREGKGEGDVHEDWGFFSFDSDRGKLVLRQFLTEGYVNTYVLEEIGSEENSLTFTTESSESAGGTRARLRYEILGADEYRLVLELAPPGKDFFGCRDLKMERVK